MATFTLTIHTDNEAFQPDPADEIARILRDLANYITDNGATIDLHAPIHDYNGNNVGTVSLHPARPPIL